MASSSSACEKFPRRCARGVGDGGRYRLAIASNANNNGDINSLEQQTSTDLQLMTSRVRVGEDERRSERR